MYSQFALTILLASYIFLWRLYLSVLGSLAIKYTPRVDPIQALVHGNTVVRMQLCSTNDILLKGGFMEPSHSIQKTVCGSGRELQIPVSQSYSHISINVGKMSDYKGAKEVEHQHLEL